MKFDKWFNQYQWWHEEDCRKVFFRLWSHLDEYYNGDWNEIVSDLDDVVSVMKSEYGE